MSLKCIWKETFLLDWCVRTFKNFNTGSLYTFLLLLECFVDEVLQYDFLPGFVWQEILGLYFGRELDERKTFDLCSLSYKAAENKNERFLLKF